MSNFTPRAQQVLALARKEADRFHHNYIGTEHLLLGLINLGQGVAVNVLQKMGLDLDTVRQAVDEQVGLGPEAKPSGNIPYTPRVKKVLALAGKEAKSLNHSYVGTEHILLGLLREGEGVAARVLKSLDVDVDRCRNEILSELDPNFASSEEKESSVVGGDADEPEEKGKDVKTPALKAFGRDLTELAKKGDLDPVVGRSAEIRRVTQVLCRRTKNNPVLIGEAGVGKTAIVEGLAQQIAGGLVPENLIDKKVVTLDLALMVAGTKYRGQFEERIKAVMDELRKAKNIIIFIDELHTIVGAGAAEGAMDASNIFKPALSRGELQCIGATTLAEHRKYIEKDSALDRRFQSVKVEAPSIEDTVKILQGIRSKYEDHHNVNYTDKSLEAAAKLTDRYVTGKFLPDKAIDAIDEAGARSRMESMQRPQEIEDLSDEIKEICASKESAISDQNFEDAAEARDKEKKLRAKRERVLESWKKNREQNRADVNEDDMLQVVADWTGIPLNRMESKESKKLLQLEEELREQVVGQDFATQVVAKALRRSRADLKDPKRPIGSFMFLGPTGVGKTHLAKVLSERIFGDQESLIQVDMSEYMEKHAVSRMIGSPPGYVGHDEGGQLTEAIRRRPYSVILFDEIEKAHPDVAQILLQILEDGRLTDSLGRKVDFRNTILIMTSNVGAEILQRNTSLGFSVSNAEQDFDKIKEKILEEAKKIFKPEFLNRLTEIVIFRQLFKEHMTAIVELELEKVSDRLKERKLKLDVSKEAKDFLIEHGYDKKLGARPLRRAVERYLEDNLAEALLAGDIRKSVPIQVLLHEDEKIGLRFEQAKKGKKKVSVSSSDDDKDSDS
ncbi:ATP-dependent Clp protease ATP-binding subunit [Candidatus Chordibacter forsetii]|uniref:ATP-dependent Clp protease ATP-binding subunit n=1 Tax=Candidatus Chordibacter forsetii TaxID=3381758 RepID=UPI00389A65A6